MEVRQTNKCSEYSMSAAKTRFMGIKLKPSLVLQNLINRNLIQNLPGYEAVLKVVGFQFFQGIFSRSKS